MTPILSRKERLNKIKIYTHTHARTHIHMRTHMHTRMRTHTHRHTTHADARTYVRTYTRTHTFSYTHTFNQRDSHACKSFGVFIKGRPILVDNKQTSVSLRVFLVGSRWHAGRGCSRHVTYHLVASMKLSSSPHHTPAALLPRSKWLFLRPSASDGGCTWAASGL